MKTYEECLEESRNVHLAYYVRAADILGIDCKILVKSLLAEFKYKNKVWHIINTATPLTTTTSTTICKRKNLTNMVLERHGIPVPIQQNLQSIDDALTFFHNQKDIVIKPTQQLGGKGVAILPQTEQEVIDSYNIALSSSLSKTENKVIGEKFIAGENYRFLVLGDSVIGIARRKSAHIIGDGEHNISQLIEQTNILRKDTLLKPILIDKEVEQKLSRDGISLNTVPEKEQEIILRYNCNLTTGGTTEECANEVHDYYKQIAIKAVKVVGAKFGGVDIIAKNISKPDEMIINEINYNPGLRLHYKVDKGNVVDVALPIMEYIRDNI